MYKFYLFKSKVIFVSILLTFCLSISFASDPKVLKMVFVPASEKGDESDYESLIAIISRNTKVKIESIKVIDTMLL